MTTNETLERVLRECLDYFGEGIERNYSDNSSATGWFIDDDDFAGLVAHLREHGCVLAGEVEKIIEAEKSLVSTIGENFGSPPTRGIVEAGLHATLNHTMQRIRALTGEKGRDDGDE